MSSDSKHILGNFQKALDELNADLARMAGIVERSLERAVRGLLERDTALCAEVIADDEEVDQLEKKIDAAGIRIITLYQPVAADLRNVISAMKVCSNLERVGDQAVNIAKRARKINKSAELPETAGVQPLCEAAANQLRRALEAYRSGDVATAVGTKRDDKSLDAACKEFAKALTRRMAEDPTRVKDYLDLHFIARFLERVGDHAKNISEDAVFAEAAVDIRHGGKLPGAQADTE